MDKPNTPQNQSETIPSSFPPLQIHPTSLIHPSSLPLIHPTATIGPFCLVGPNVSIGARTVLLSHVSIPSNTALSADCTVHPFSVLGGASQAIADKALGDTGRLTLGNNCTIREGVTCNVGFSEKGTVIGSGCLLMANSHVAHDCIVGDEVILVNGVLLAGHVTVGRGAIFAGLGGAVQHVRVGEYAYVGGATVVSRDVLPFSMVKGYRGLTVGVNAVGLKRRGWSRERIEGVSRAVKAVLRSDEKVLRELVQELVNEGADDVARLMDFARESERGLCLLLGQERGITKL
ncbi:putative acyl---UDP-N-acetylglucosamine-O-acyltransferase [Cercophora samala]|uniref:Acyl---UDP-N-acetylglucosamine-O-acyltransferase n=1 Tax=Cercophora samala TaxID=330535 RepID=A0AA39YL67_9PEZI|nr:putative acyl---UDP-N-acetylglucosamine-O-acyltransferase [Cercophora samala]